MSYHAVGGLFDFLKPVTPSEFERIDPYWVTSGGLTPSKTQELTAPTPAQTAPPLYVERPDPSASYVLPDPSEVAPPQPPAAPVPKSERDGGSVNMAVVAGLIVVAAGILAWSTTKP